MEMTSIVHPRAYQILQGLIKLPQEKRGGAEEKLLEQQFGNLLEDLEKESKKHDSVYVIRKSAIQKPK